MLLVVAAAILIVTGLVNAVSGPLGYLSDANVGVLVLGGDPLVLAGIQTVCGVAWAVFGVLLLFRRRFAWGAAMTAALVFATYEAYFVSRGAIIHFVGIFLAATVLVVLYQNPVRERCNVAPPADAGSEAQPGGA